MNELKPEDVMDILDRMDFFQGQRAGRELWHDKPFEVQEQDIADFTKGIAAVKAFIKVALALLREKDACIEELEAENREVHSNWQQIKEALDVVTEEDKHILAQKDAEIERLKGHSTLLKIRYNICKQNVTTERTKAITEFAERLKECTECVGECTVENPLAETYSVVREEYIDEIAKEILKENEQM